MDGLRRMRIESRVKKKKLMKKKKKKMAMKKKNVDEGKWK